MPSTHPAPTVDPVAEALSSLKRAMSDANPDDSRSLESVLLRFEELRATTSLHSVDAERFPDVRAQVDDAMTSLQTLVAQITAARDKVGRELANLRQRRRTIGPTGDTLGASRLDISR